MSLLADEEGHRRVYELERARAWRRSGLIDDRQLSAIEAEDPPPPALAGPAMRLLLFGLTAGAMLACGGLIFLLWGGSSGPAAILLVQGVLALAAGELAAARLRLHRFGADEALQLGGAVLLTLGAAASGGAGWRDSGLALFAGGAAGLVAFGFVYARRLHSAALLGVVGSAAAMVVGFQPAHPRAALALTWTVLLGASFLRREVPEFERELWQALQCALAVLLLLTVNLGLEAAFGGGTRREASLYWSSYLAVWLLPAAALAWSLSRRHRPLLMAGILGLLLAAATDKSYWGVPRRDWDPAVLGLLLTAVAAGVERWLRTGPLGRRGGFTADEVLVAREDLSAAGAFAAAAAGMAAQGVMPAAPPQARPDFGGGSSGGAGAGDSF